MTDSPIHEDIFFDHQTAPRTSRAFDAIAADLATAHRFLVRGEFDLAAEAVASVNDQLKTLCDARAMMKETT